jgi:hypothetical protein
MVAGENNVCIWEACISNKLRHDEHILPSYKEGTITTQRILCIDIEAADFTPLVVGSQVHGASWVSKKSGKLP